MMQVDEDGDLEVPGTPGLFLLPNGTEEYKVEKVVSKKFIDGKLHYRIKWVGWDTKDNTWEPIANLKNCMDLVKQYEEKLKGLHPVPQEVDKMKSGKGAHDGQERKRKRGESEDEDDNEDDEVEKQREVDEGRMGPMFRRTWRSIEIPVRVLSSTVFEGDLFHLIKIRKAGEEEVAEDPTADPMDGLSSDNLVTVLADYFNEKFPDMVAEYYESKLVLIDNDKREEEDVEAITAALHNQGLEELDPFGLPEDMGDSNSESDEDGCDLGEFPLPP